jgi:XapX domain-containing protein
VKLYVVSLATGLLVGVIYGLLKVRSPAPPVVALVGLLGILAGEQLVPLVKQMIAGHSVAAAWRRADCNAHMFGQLPGNAARTDKPILNDAPEVSS